MYDTMDLIVPILIIAAIAVIILAFFKSMKEINDNKKAPLLSVPAKVSGKRTDIIKRNQPNAGDLSGAHGYTVVMNTTYYVSFEIEDGERKEFIVDHSIYNTLLNIQYVIGRNERDTVIQGNKIYIFRVTEDFSINVEYRRKLPVLQYRGLSLCAFTVHEPRLVAVIYSCLTICRYSGRLY